MQARAFNEMNVDLIQGIITKSSCNTAKLKDEVHYYLSLPHPVAQFFPKLIDYKKDYSAYTIEYFPHQDLSEIILSKSMTLENGKTIITQLINILDKMHQFNDVGQINYIDVQNFYINKTISRINDLRNSRVMQTIVEAPEICINGKHYKNFTELQNQFAQAICKRINITSPLAVIHGDFCFSNILYNTTNGYIKLIDPRGSFGSVGIYGDVHYDFAKILHCLHGRYDCLVKGYFNLKEPQQNYFIFEKIKYSLLDELYDFYKKLVQQRNIDFETLILIEASLFLSMSSLHYEDLTRQKALYLTGIMILNNFFESDNENLY